MEQSGAASRAIVAAYLLTTRQVAENSFQVCVPTVPFFFIVDHWCPHSCMRLRAGASCETCGCGADGALPDDGAGAGPAGGAA